VTYTQSDGKQRARGIQNAVFGLKTFTEIPLKDDKRNPIVRKGFPETIEQVLARQPSNNASYAATAWRRQGGVGQKAGRRDQEVPAGPGSTIKFQGDLEEEVVACATRNVQMFSLMTTGPPV